MGKTFEDLTMEELCDLMCGGPEDDLKEGEQMTRLEILKAEKEQIKGLRCLSFGLIDKCIER